MAPLVIPFPDIDPVALQIGPLAVKWYGLAYVAGLMLGWLYMKRLVSDGRLWRDGKPPFAATLADDLFLWVAVGVVVGGRLGHVLLYEPGPFLRDPLEIFKIWHGGMAFHGGMLGTIIAMWLFARQYKVPVPAVMEVVAASVPFGLFFGRVANFINGELWGRPTDVAWGVVFPAGGPAPRHPSQLYEAVLEGLVLFVVLALMIRAGALKRPGLIIGVFAVGYAVARSLCELVREPDPQLGYLWGGLTMGTLLSLPLLLAGLAFIAFALRREPLRRK